MKKRLVAEVFIIVLILLSFIEFFGMLPSDIDFVKKIVSWTILGFLLYHASLTKVFFGDRHKWIDIGLIIAFFAILLKDLVVVAKDLFPHGGFFSEVYRLVAENVFYVEASGFMVGTVLLILFSLYLTFTLHVRKPSVLHVLHRQGLPKHVGDYVQRFVLIFVVLNAFFILVFNLLMEWLAIAIDADIVVITVIVALLVFAKKHAHQFSTTAFLFAIGNSVERFYEKFIELFHDKQKFALGFSGLLVLHLLTDVGVFLIPQLLTFQESIYFGEVGVLSIWSLLKEQVVGVSLLDQASMVYLYVFNVLALVFLMVAPAYIWSKVYKGKGFRVTHKELALFFASLFALILAPIFTMENITGNELIGVSIFTTPLQGLDPGIAALISILVGVVVYAKSYSHKLREGMLVTALGVIVGFFSYYIYLYFISSIQYYVNSVELLWNASYYYFSAYFALFLVIVVLAYIGGWFAFIGETRREYRYIK